MLSNGYVNLYNAQYLGCLSLAPCYASINIGNLFENFVWKLDIYIYIEHVCFFFFFFFFNVWVFLIILCGLFED